MKQIFLFFVLIVFTCSSCSRNVPTDISTAKTYVEDVPFFPQAPLGTEENWRIHTESCEEASVLLYASFLQGKNYDKNSFDTELKNMIQFQQKTYGKETDIKKYALKDFINDYFTDLQAKVALNLSPKKITWLLQDGSPILIGVKATDIENPYYHYARYHTLLIVGETEKDYIVKDVGTKHGDDWKYPKEEILKAIKKEYNWGIIIEKIETQTTNTDNIKDTEGFNYSTFQSKKYYNDLILDEHCCLDVQIPNDVGAGIVAHHLTVGPYFDNFFRKLKEVRPDIQIFVLGGTNHFNFDSEIYTTNLPYRTPFGDLEIAENMELPAVVNNKLLYNEHSIHSVVGFIKKYFPNATIYPFIVNDTVSEEQLITFSQALFEHYTPHNSFYIQSTDFTHFQPQYATDFHDLYSKNILDDFDTKRVKNMMVDGRVLQHLSFSFLEKLGMKHHYNLKNSSSNNFFQIENFLNTSHFFSYFGSGEQEQKSEQVSLLFTGDMILNYDIPPAGKMTETGKTENIAYPFDIIDSFEETFFRSFDEIIINIEGNFGEKTYEKDVAGGPIYFQFDDDWLGMIKNVMKAKVLFFSNNHLRDFGQEGIDTTKNIVEKAGLKFIGTGTGFFPEKNVYTRKIGNKELVVINVNDVVTPLFDYDLELMQEYIQKHKKENSIVVVYVHWGREYELKANERQEQLGHLFIDYGADLVVGNHTHTIQQKEQYKGKMIYYSLGNLTYDSTRQEAYIPQAEYGVFLGVNFHHNTVDFFEKPYKIIERKPHLLIGEEKEKVLKYLEG